MDTIETYVENMFKTLPQTAELQNIKDEILTNMKDKYNELKADGKTENEAVGIVISEFGNIDEIISEFNIDVNKSKEKEEKYDILPLKIIRTFLEEKKNNSFLISIGVALCLLGASALIFISELIDNGVIFKGMGERMDSVPVIVLLVFVVAAVALFIYSGSRMEKYKYIEKGEFYIDNGTKKVLKDEYVTIKSQGTKYIIIGVCLCILSPLCLFIGDMIVKDGSSYGVSVLLLIIALAVGIFINGGSIGDGYKQILRLEDYEPSKKESDKVIGIVSSIVWPIAVCVFLLWGFVYGGWGICWIVFPITGILFGGFSGIYSAIKGK